MTEPFQTRLKLLVYALAPWFSYVLGELRVLLVRFLQFLDLDQPLPRPRFQNPSWDYYLFAFLEIAYPLLATLLFFFGIRTMKKLIPSKDESFPFIAFLPFYVLGALSYFIPITQVFTPRMVQIIFLLAGILGLASLARLRELHLLKSETPHSKIQR